MTFQSIFREVPGMRCFPVLTAHFVTCTDFGSVMYCSRPSFLEHFLLYIQYRAI